MSMFDLASVEPGQATRKSHRMSRSPFKKVSSAFINYVKTKQGKAEGYDLCRRWQFHVLPKELKVHAAY